MPEPGRRVRLPLLALDLSPIVVQVPDFGDRFWVYQVVDLRTDSFAEFGKMYGTKPGFYLLVGPNWTGKVPKGITKVLSFHDKYRRRDSPRVPGRYRRGQEGRAGRDIRHRSLSARGVRRKDEAPDWAALPKFPSEAKGEAETKWVLPERSSMCCRRC